MAFKEALALAQEKGYAEADPTFDIEGVDSAHKLTLLCQLAFEKNIKFSDIYCNGITRIEQSDIECARELGYVIKLLAIAKKTKEGIEARVQPTLLPKDHMLANVNGSFNAVYLHGDEVGEMLFYGKGAGARPTASAIVSDIADCAKQVQTEQVYKDLESIAAKKLINIHSRYYLRFSVIDRPGVLADISRILGRVKISISDVIQRERKAGKVVPLILLTHEALEKDIRQAVEIINMLPVIKQKTQVVRIEE